MAKLTREDCIRLLRQKQETLSSASPPRFPKRGDFTAEEIQSIKAFLGPWPRALETAGLKEERDEALLAQKKEMKRLEAKRKKIMFKKTDC